jgi:monovalent cation:H+ antiporter, CPA1 family
MTLFQTLTALITLAALAAYLNHRFLDLPPTIGLMAIALGASLILVLLGETGILEVRHFARFVAGIDFSDLLFHGMLAFLLFAGAMHVDLADLRQVKWSVSVLATIGTIISTFVVGILFWLAARWLGYQLAFIHALLFGALISPTDPIAVLGIIKKAGAPKELETRITGESLFNDGVGVVIFLTVLEIASGQNEPSAARVAWFFIEEAFGGIALGWLLGWIVFRMLRRVDDYQVETMLSLALCVGTYALAETVHVSAPIAVVVAGLLIGNQGYELAMSKQTQEYLDMFWELIDEILNSMLFLLIGLEIIAIRAAGTYLLLGLLGIICVLAGRWISVLLPIGIMGARWNFPGGTIKLLTWGGLRGAISIALALLVPHGPEKELILTTTYIVVVFSVLVQGLTFGPLLRRSIRSHPDMSRATVVKTLD